MKAAVLALATVQPWMMAAATAGNAWETNDDVGAAEVDVSARLRRGATCAWCDNATTRIAPCNTTATPDECGGIAEQVHVSLGKYDAATQTWSMVVSWADSTRTTRDWRPVVRVAAGTTVDGATCSPLSNQADYNTTDYTWRPKWEGPFYIKDLPHERYQSPLLHHVTVTSLKPATKHTYQVAYLSKDAGEYMLREDAFSFRTPARPGMAPGSADIPTPVMTILAIGDIGQTVNSTHTRDAMMGRFGRQGDGDIGAVLGLIIGDMSYADGNATRWDKWGRHFERLFAKLPLMVLPGNHEIEIDVNNSEAFAAYRHRFRMPGDGAEATLPNQQGKVTNYAYDLKYEAGSSYWALDVGLVHILCLNTYDTHGELQAHKTGGKSAQQRYVEADLAAVDRAVTPFVLVFMHGPFHNHNEKHQEEAATGWMQKWAEPLFYTHGVNMVFAGHVHAYERHYPMTRDWALRDASAPIYITVGNGGNHEHLYDEWIADPTYSCAYQNGRYFGHGEISVYNRTHISWSWVPNAVQNAGPKDRDEVWVECSDQVGGGCGMVSMPPSPASPYAFGRVFVGVAVGVFAVGFAVIILLVVIRRRAKNGGAKWRPLGADASSGVQGGAYADDL